MEAECHTLGKENIVSSDASKMVFKGKFSNWGHSNLILPLPFIVIYFADINYRGLGFGLVIIPLHDNIITVVFKARSAFS